MKPLASVEYKESRIFQMTKDTSEKGGIQRKRNLDNQKPTVYTLN